MAWYDNPYKKGRAVGPEHLPRVLDPPNGNVEMGDDVTAIKRAMSHAQRWMPWAPSQWDNRYSKPFAMGKGTGNVGDSGVRGFQRQEGLKQDGVLGDTTYQHIRRSLIPEGPRQGEHILDAISIALIRSAIAEFSPAGQTEKVRAAMADFCERAEDAERLWHYTQQRPFSGLGLAPERSTKGTARATASSPTSGRGSRRTCSCPIPRSTATRAMGTPGMTSTGTHGSRAATT